MITITRVYLNGDCVKRLLADDKAEAELTYSMLMRPGCALFRNSECVQVGYLGAERCEAISAKLKETEPSPTIPPLEPRTWSELLESHTYHSIVCMHGKTGQPLLPRDVTRSAWELDIDPIDAVQWWNAIQAADAPIR